jgi:hypothetical protein
MKEEAAAAAGQKKHPESCSEWLKTAAKKGCFGKRMQKQPPGQKSSQLQIFLPPAPSLPS